MVLGEEIKNPSSSARRTSQHNNYVPRGQNKSIFKKQLILGMKASFQSAILGKDLFLFLENSLFWEQKLIKMI